MRNTTGIDSILSIICPIEYLRISINTKNSTLRIKSITSTFQSGEQGLRIINPIGHNSHLI